MLAVAAASERVTRAMRSLEALFLIDVEGVTEIWLVRHADCYRGMTEVVDPPLSAVGGEQALRLAGRLRHVEPAAVYSTPLRRPAETAHAIAAAVNADRRLRGDA